jgi:hypothetical protein
VTCSEHGVKLVEVPWACEGSALTLLFEQAALTLAQEMPVNMAARIIEINDHRLCRIIEHYVAKRVVGFDLSPVHAVGLNDDTAAFLGTARALKGNAGHLGCEAFEQAAAMAQAAAEVPGFVLRTLGRAVYQAMRLAMRETEEAVLALQPLAPQAGVISLTQRRRSAS